MSTNNLTCPNCQFENQQSSRYCSKCGYPLVYLKDEQEKISEESKPSRNFAASTHKICSGCQTVNTASAKYCSHCGLLLPMEIQPEGDSTEALAGFWIRLAAYCIDGIILSLLNYLINLGFNLSVDANLGIAILDDPTFWTMQIIGFLLRAVYYTYCTGRWGQTPGKFVTGIKIVRSDDTPLSYPRSLARFLATFLSELTLGIGYLMIAFSTRKRALHDLICDTKVIRIRK